MDQFFFKMVILPPGTPCGWLGQGTVGCDGTLPCLAWVDGPTFLGASVGAGGSAQVAMHQQVRSRGCEGGRSRGRGRQWDAPHGTLDGRRPISMCATTHPIPHPYCHQQGHNLYLDHAATASDDQGDGSCAMGGIAGGARCFNTPHAYQLGWLRTQQLDGTSLPPATTVSVTLPAQTRGAPSGLRIRLPFMGATSLFLGYRLPEGGDAGLPAAYTGKVSVYSHAATDNYNGLGALSYHLAALGAPGAAFTHAPTGIVFTLTGVDAEAGQATVRVCRTAASSAETATTCEAGADGDCNGLAGGDDPACAAFLASPPPPSPSPPPPADVPSPPPPADVPSPPPPAGPAANTVSFTARLAGETVVSFDAAKQDAYKALMAQEAGGECCSLVAGCCS